MSKHGTAIQWTHVPGFKGETWNPTTGCDKVSPGCARCYACDFAARLKGMGQPAYQKDGDPKSSGPGFGLTLHPDKLDLPLRWKKPRAVFVNSMSDLFHEDIPDEFIAEVFGVMAAAPQHIFMVLTKRPKRMQQVLSSPAWQAKVLLAADRGDGVSLLWPLRNVWMGVTIENRRFVDRADLLRETPAAVRFISAEPLLGPLVHNPFFPAMTKCWFRRPPSSSSSGAAPVQPRTAASSTAAPTTSSRLLPARYPPRCSAPVSQ